MRKQSFSHLVNGCHLVVLCAVVAAIMAPRAAASPTTALVESLTATTEPDRFRYRGAAHTVEQDGIIQYAELDRSPGLKWDWPVVECLPGVPYAAYVEFYAPRKFLQHAEKLTFVLEGKPGEPVRASLDLDGVPPDAWQIAYMGTVMGDHGGSGFAVSAEPDSNLKNLKWYADQKLRIRRFWAVPAMGKIDPEQFLVAYRTWLVEQIRDREYLANYQAPHYPIAEDMFHIGGYFGGSGWTPNLFGLAAYWNDDTAEATKAYRELFYRDMKHRGLNCTTDGPSKAPDLKMNLELARKYDMYVLAGSMRRISKKSSFAGLRRINWEGRERDIKKWVEPFVGNPNLAAYYLIDEPRAWLTIPLLRSMELYGRCDPTHPPLVMGLSSTPQLNTRAPILFARIRYKYESQYGLTDWLTGVGEAIDRHRSLTDRRMWMILHGYGDHRRGGARLPTPEEMEAQTYLALAGHCTSLSYYIYYNRPQWRGEIGLVDSYMNPTAALERLSEIAIGLKGVGEMLAAGEYLEDAGQVLELTTDEFSKTFSKTGHTQSWPQVRHGLYELRDGQGYLLVAVNQTTEAPGTCRVELQANDPVTWCDLVSLEPLGPPGTGQTLRFEPGQGRLVWIGKSDQWPGVQDRIRFARAFWRAQVLAHDVEEAVRYGVDVPDMSFIDEIAWGKRRGPGAGERLASEVDQARKAFAKACAGHETYTAVTRKLDTMQTRLGAVAKRMPRNSAYTADAPVKPPEQKMNKASGTYVRLRIKHIRQACSLEEVNVAYQRVMNLLVEVEKEIR